MSNTDTSWYTSPKHPDYSSFKKPSIQVMTQKVQALCAYYTQWSDDPKALTDFQGDFISSIKTYTKDGTEKIETLSEKQCRVICRAYDELIGS